MGFFTDAYDLFVIGIVVCLLTSQWNLSTSQCSPTRQPASSSAR